MALAVPVTLKTTEVGENERLDYTVSAMQGHRENMEDAHAIVLDLDAATGTSFFGVYDGHGGPAVSKYCARHLHIELRRHESFRDNLQIAIERTFLRMDEMMKDRRARRELSGYGGNDNWKAYRKAMRTSLFLPFCQKPAYPGPENDGCTACVVLIRGNEIIVGNAGDSRCVLSRNNLAIDLSKDFKPNLPAERQRIEAAGHVVTFSERGNVHHIDDGIAISRSLGDTLYKDNNNLGPQEQAITAFPEVRTEEITQDDQFLIIACDGIWDFLTSQQAVDFIRIYLNAHAIVLDLDAATGTSFFGVYDGHGGPAVSKYCARHLHIELRGHERFHDNLQTAIERTFLRMDEMTKDRRAGRELSVYGGNDNWKAYRKAMRTSLFLPFCQKPAYPGPENDGCTACVVLIRGNQIIVGNAGDSRCVLSRNNLEIDLSTNFKPNLPAERQRIEAAGHVVTFSERGSVHRIGDGIAISRSLGDLLYKDNNDFGPQEQAITAFPEVLACTTAHQDAGPICLLYLERAPLIKMQRYMMQKTFAYYAGWVEAKLTRHQMGLLTEAVFEMINQGPNANFANRIRNTVTMVLDGHNYDVWTQYVYVMAHIRFWFVLNGVSLNIRHILGYDKFIHVVPSEGTLHLVLRYGPESINIIIDAREAWMHGVAGAKAIIQFARTGRTPYIQHEYTIKLGGEGKYMDMSKGGVGDIPIGLDALKAVVSVLVNADENSDVAEVAEKLGALVLHFMEAMKFDRVYQIVSESIWSGESTTLKQKDPVVAALVKIWGKAAKKTGIYVFDYLYKRRPGPLCLKSLKVDGIETLEDVLANMFIMPQSFIPMNHRKQKSSEKVNSTWSPVDAGKGDAKVIPLHKLYSQIQAQREQSMRDKKFIEDRRKYFGNRSGGEPCYKAIAFVKSEARNGAFSWRSPLPVKGSHISTVAKIAKKFSRFFK